MVHWRQIPTWLIRAWPVLALLPAFVAHLMALGQFPASAAMVNKIVGMTLQLVGGLVILYSINDNLGLFRKQSLLVTVAQWFRSFPLVRKSVTIQLSGVASAGMTGSASITTSVAPKTLEERVSRLEETLKSLCQEVAANAAAAQQHLQDAKAELGTRIAATSDQVTELTKKVEHAAVGGFKLQAFGVLLAVYGAVTSVYA